MSLDIKTFEISDGIRMRAVKDDRFKTGRISLTMLLPLTEQTAARNAVMLYTLQQSCNKYSSSKQLNEKLDFLYGASLNAEVFKIGESQALKLSIQGLSDKYIPDNSSISAQLSEFLCELIFNPNTKDLAFVHSEIQKAKLEILDILSEEFSDKRIYAKKRCNELMCEGEAYAISRFGKKEDIEALSDEEIFDAWQSVLLRAKIEITAIGMFDFDKIAKSFEEKFKKIKRDYSPFEYVTIKETQKARYVEDNMDLSQAKLVLGYRAQNVRSFEEKMSYKLMCAILGGTPSSKLFLNVREKLSLCYYCSSSFDSNKCVMFVESGVEDENIQKAKCEISNQLDAIRDADFDEEMISANKLALQNSYLGISDSLGRLESFYLSQLFEDKLRSPEEYADFILGINKNDIIKAAKNTALCMIYILTK